MKLFNIIKDKKRLVINDEVQSDGNEYFTCEYNKIGKRMSQIGVSIGFANRVVVKQFDHEVVQLTLDDDSGIWYHEQKEWIEDGFKRTTDGIFGINAGGSFEVIAYDEFDNMIETAIVNITPGTMTIEEYQQMQSEVQRLFELFSYDLTKVEKRDENMLKRVQLPFFPLDQFQELLEQFYIYFNEIANAPEQDLIRMEKKISLFQVKKWTPSIIIENEVRQNGKVTASINETTNDIPEHKMIRFMVEEFQKRINMELLAEQKYLDSLREELYQLLEVEKKETTSLVVNFRNLISIIKSDCSKLENRIENWMKIKNIVEEILEHPILECGPHVVEETHLFRMHPFYSEVYSIFIEYEYLTPVLSETFRLFIQSILKSPTLYEIWVLLKIIEQFSQWGLNPYEFFEEIQEKYKTLKTISGYKKIFRLENKPFDLVLYYDYSFEKTGYRPDFIIGFFNRKKNKWHLHTLDAKYKSYSKMKKGTEKLLYDLNHSGTRYLNKLFSNNPKVSVMSASLIHVDVGSINWNVKYSSLNPKRSQHRLAHFYFTPNDNANLKVFLKRLLHECSHLESCCPECGRDIKGIKEEKNAFGNKLRWKTTYICEECEEVWVANFCSTCSYKDRGLRNIRIQDRIYTYPRPLFKYPKDNFNIQVKENWDVHCPTCYKTANHWINYEIQESILNGVLLQKK